MNVHLLKVKWKEGELQQNTYVVEQKDGCILIDAGVPLEEIRKITDKPISAVMLTHAHFDHIEYIEEYLVRAVVILDKNINNQQIRKSNKTFTEEPAQNYVSDPNL